MSDFVFSPLELWRASNLAQETKNVIVAYERCLSTRDDHGLARLRRIIEDRIDQLEHFCLQNQNDERTSLFERQKNKLRKLLSEYDAAIAMLNEQEAQGAQIGIGAPLHMQQSSSNYLTEMNVPLGSGGYSQQSLAQNVGSMTMQSTSSSRFDNTESLDANIGMTTRTITESTRLNLLELSAWFTQAGHAEMPELTLPIIERVWTHTTRINPDGRMSIRDLRQWYISFGKKAIEMGLTEQDLEKELLPRRLLDLIKEHMEKRKRSVGNSSVGRTRTLSQTKSNISQSFDTPTKPLYSWEVEPTPSYLRSPRRQKSSTTDEGNTADPMKLPHGQLSFHIVMTEDEYNKMSVRRRQIEAEMKYRERVAKVQSGKTGSVAFTGVIL